MEEPPWGPPTWETWGVGTPWGRALSPGWGHSRATQMGEAEQRGG